jgi:hypothetical protein
LIVEKDTSQIKIEVNIVFRGTVLPVEHQPLSARTRQLSARLGGADRMLATQPRQGAACCANALGQAGS